MTTIEMNFWLLMDAYKRKLSKVIEKHPIWCSNDDVNSVCALARILDAYRMNNCSIESVNFYWHEAELKILIKKELDGLITAENLLIDAMDELAFNDKHEVFQRLLDKNLIYTNNFRLRCIQLSQKVTNERFEL